ncbi:MAG: hypothetical protein ACI9LV_000183 [Candidatus Nanohaloarchaea archaeon]|jgi:hypothetical protein
MNSDLEQKKERNKEQRREFITQWVEYIKNHSDEEWSRQQNIVINSQLKTAKQE